MFDIGIVVAYILLRYRFPGIKVVPYFMGLFFLLLMLLFFLAGKRDAAESMGSEVFLFFTLTIVELFITRYFEFSTRGGKSEEP